MKKKVLYLLTLALLAAVPDLQACAEEEYYEEEYEDGEYADEEYTGEEYADEEYAGEDNEDGAYEEEIPEDGDTQ